MTPARSLAASVIALGFASSLTAPPPAFAAPAPCEGAENYAAQSGAETLRLDRLAWHTTPGPERPSSKSSKSSSSGRSSPRRESESVTDTATGLLGSQRDITGGDFGDSGEGVTGFLSGTGDLLKSITNGGVTAPAGSVNPVSGGQGGGGPVEGDSATVGGVGLGQTKTAMIAVARTNAVAVGRMIDGKDPLGKPLIQTAPPNSADASRLTSAGSAGPLHFGAGDLVTHATWDPAMACGKAFGDVARSSATLKHVQLLDLLHTPDALTGQSSTSFTSGDDGPRSVATATTTTGRINLAGGRIKVKVLHPPTLTTSMGTAGGSVVYKPAQVVITWPGGRSKTLNTAGDSVDISLGAGGSTESAPTGPLPELGGLLPALPLPLPSVPGLPSVATPDTESAPAAGHGVSVRISLGEAHQATKGHAIAAKAAAIRIAIAEGSSSYGDGKKKNGRGKDGYGDVSSSVVAQLSLGMLEAAAVAPESAPQKNSGVGGSAALPITGPQAGLFAAGGIALLVAGGAALLLGRRRRRLP
jgi:hypothetical protein